MAAEPQKMGTQAQVPADRAGPLPAAPVPLPYVPTPEEMQYLEECAAAIVAGCQTAAEAAKVGNGAEYLQYANGVKAFTDAYQAIKNGGKPSRHEGA